MARIAVSSVLMLVGWLLSGIAYAAPPEANRQLSKAQEDCDLLSFGKVLLSNDWDQEELRVRLYFSARGKTCSPAQHGMQVRLLGAVGADPNYIESDIDGPFWLKVARSSTNPARLEVLPALVDIGADLGMAHTLPLFRDWLDQITDAEVRRLAMQILTSRMFSAVERGSIAEALRYAVPLAVYSKESGLEDTLGDQLFSQISIGDSLCTARTVTLMGRVLAILDSGHPVVDEFEPGDSHTAGARHDLYYIQDREPRCPSGLRDMAGALVSRVSQDWLDATRGKVGAKMWEALGGIALQAYVNTEYSAPLNLQRQEWLKSADYRARTKALRAKPKVGACVAVGEERGVIVKVSSQAISVRYLSGVPGPGRILAFGAGSLRWIERVFKARKELRICD